MACGVSGLTGARTEPVIFISAPTHSPTTLAHELGHVLGLWDYEAEDLPDSLISIAYGFWSLVGLGPLGRSRFTVGHTFRLNFDEESWLFKGTSPIRTVGSLNCGTDGTPNDPKCPDLAADEG